MNKMSFIAHRKNFDRQLVFYTKEGTDNSI